MRHLSRVIWLIAILALVGCGTINTVFRPDAVASQNLKNSRSHCENVPRIYSGVMYGFCTLNGEPKPERSLNDPSLSNSSGNALPIIAIEFLGSGVLDTLVLPYTIYRQNKDGSIEIYQ